jgi:hypothetical protein
VTFVVVIKSHLFVMEQKKFRFLFVGRNPILSRSCFDLGTVFCG